MWVGRFVGSQLYTFHGWKNGCKKTWGIQQVAEALTSLPVLFGQKACLLVTPQEVSAVRDSLFRTTRDMMTALLFPGLLGVMTPIGLQPNSNCLQSNSNGLQPASTSNGLQPHSDGLQPDSNCLCSLVAMAFNLPALATTSNLIAMASNLPALAMTSNLIAMASNLPALAMTSNLIAMASNLPALAMTSNLIAMASNLPALAMTSNLIAMVSNILALLAIDRIAVSRPSWGGDA